MPDTVMDEGLRARRRLWEWSHGRGSHFVMHLFDLMAFCDEENLRCLERAFPQEVVYFKRRRLEEGFYNELDGEFDHVQIQRKEP